LSLITEYPIWFIVLCLLAGAIYAGALYTKDRLNRHFSKPLIVLLAAARFIVVTTIAFFLLNPLLKSTEREVEKPIVVVAQDASESLVVGEDSTFYKGEYLDQLRQISTDLGEDYEVRTYTFGEKVSEGIDSLSYNQKFTDFSDLLDEVYNRYTNRNLGAIVISTDGLYNKGTNPVYAYRKLNVPVYTVAMGDTTPQRDVLIKNVAHNRLAYLGNKFPLEIVTEARQAQGERVTLRVSRGGETLFSENLEIGQESFFKTIPVTLEAKETGLQRYRISVSTIENEVTTVNNVKDIFIDVLDSRQRVLMLASNPHPDLRALKRAISSNDNYKVTSELLSDFDGNTEEYDLVIFHQLPDGTSLSKSTINKTLDSGVPSLFIWGGETNFSDFNELQLGFSLENYRRDFRDVGAIYAPGFSLFTLSEELTGSMDEFPPLSVPFGDVSASAGITPLAYQRIGSVQTEMPLIGFNQTRDTKIGLVAGLGIWRWQLYNYMRTQSHERFDQMITKTVQYLASKEDRSYFRVSGETDLLENERATFEAELYNKSYELINNPDVTITIRDDEGKEYPFTFSKSGEAYSLDAGLLPVGNYTYVAKATLDGSQYTETGEFSVSPIQLELAETRANHQLLINFASENNGQMLYPNELNQLPELIKNKKEIVSVAYEQETLTDLINKKWILALLLGLLAMEWLLRKRNGAY
jgi:hypothetical protein